MTANKRYRFLLALTYAALALCVTLARHPASAQQALKFEAEDVTEPADAWQKDQYSESKWNLWSTDQDAERKWSEGVVLQSPRVMADRARPQDGAPPLHTRIDNIPPGTYTVEVVGVGRPMGVSLDGENWRKIDGSTRSLGEFEITDGEFELWVDDRYASATEPGSTYYDYVLFTPIVAGEMGIANGGFEAAAEDAGTRAPGSTTWRCARGRPRGRGGRRSRPSRATRRGASRRSSTGALWPSPWTGAGSTSAGAC